MENRGGLIVEMTFLTPHMELNLIPPPEAFPDIHRSL